MPGLSPFREVQLYLDGFLAGVEWPFPVIFTGGVVPSLHRPIVGLQAFDLREQEIDITPWLPVLCDGKEHTFTIRVVGVEDDGISSASLSQSVSDSWHVTGKIFVWLDAEGSVTTGTFPIIDSNHPSFTLSHSTREDAVGLNESLLFGMDAERALSVRSYVDSQNRSGEFLWSQTLSCSHTGLLGGYGYNQTNKLSITGTDSAVGPASYYYRAAYDYPLLHDSISDVDNTRGSLEVYAHLAEGFQLKVEGDSVFSTGLETFKNQLGTGAAQLSGSLLQSFRHGIASYFQRSDGIYVIGPGMTNQTFYFGGINDTTQTELYFRNVTVASTAIVSDIERLFGVPSTELHLSTGESVGEGRKGMEGSLRNHVFQTRPPTFMGWHGSRSEGDHPSA